MPEKCHTVDQIVANLRKADLELGKGKKVPAVCMWGDVWEISKSTCCGFHQSRRLYCFQKDMLQMVFSTNSVRTKYGESFPCSVHAQALSRPNLTTKV